MQRNTAITLVTALGLTIAAPLALADEKSDQAFLTEAMSGDLAEVELGKLAQQKGQSEQVREYGRKLVQDHEKALNRAEALGKTAGVQPPQGPLPDAQRAYQRLSQLSGEEFDREFVQHMIMDHEKHIAKFSEHAEQHGGAHSDAVEHAQETLPALEEHLRIAQAIDGTQRR